MIMLYSLLFVIFVLYISYQWKFYWLAWKIGGPLGLPLIGCTGLYSPRNSSAFITKLRKSYNSPLIMWFGPICVLYVADPENVERVLTAPECINKSIVYHYLSKHLGSGLGSSNNPEWSRHRKLLNPAFKTQQLVQFVPVFNAKSKEFCCQLKELSLQKKPLHILEILNEFAFNISCETIMGQKSSNITWHGKGNTIIQSYNLLIEHFAKVVCNPLYVSTVVTKLIDSGHHKKFQEALRTVKTFVKKCAEAVSKQFPNKGIVSGPTKYSVISHSLAVSRKGLLSTEEVLTEMNQLMIASFETTGKALLHIITLLALYPEWQEKLYEEIEERFPDKDVELSFENIKDTPLIDMVIKESLRLLPVGPGLGRVTTADFILFDDVVVPKGTNIAVDIFSMHRDPKYWGEDAKLFNPYRFLQDEIAQKHPYVYIPFVKGLRNCIGWRYANLSMKVAVIKVFQRFRFATAMKPDELVVTLNLTAILPQQPLFTIEDRASQIVPLDFDQ